MRDPGGRCRKLRRDSTSGECALALTFSCHHHRRLLTTDRYCLWLIEALDRARSRHRLLVWGFVLMPDHVHLLIKPTCPECRIATILQAIKQPVSRRILADMRAGTQTPPPRFWQAGGGFVQHLDRHSTVRSMLRYIHDNPVRRGLTEWAVDWRWSSASWHAGRPFDLPVQMSPLPEW